MVKTTSYLARVEVKLKPDYMDSEGLTAKKALNDMGHVEVEEVSTAKIYEIKLKADSYIGAKKKVDRMCRKLLANPVKDNYKVEVKRAG